MNDTPPSETSAILAMLAIPVSDHVEITNIFVVESRTKRGNDERFRSGGFGLRYTHSAEFVEKSLEDKHITIKVECLVVTTRNDEPEPDPVLSIEAKLLLTYSVDSFEGIEDPNLHAFAMTNGVYNAWPYWREFVQNATVRMGLPALVPPVYRFATKTTRQIPPATQSQPKVEIERSQTESSGQIQAKKSEDSSVDDSSLMNE